MVAWSWLGLLCFSSWSGVSYLFINDIIKTQVLGLSDFEICLSRKIPIDWVIKLCYLRPHSFLYRWTTGTKNLACTRRRKVTEQGLLFIHGPALVIRHLYKYSMGSGLFQMAKHCTYLSSRSGPRWYTCEGKASSSYTEIGN